MRIVKTKNYTFANELGFALALIGIQLGTAIRNVIPMFDLGYFFMFLSILFVADYKNLFSGKISNFGGIGLFLALLFQIISFFYLVLSTSTNVDFTPGKLVLMEAYVIAFIIMLLTNKRTEFRNFDRILFYLTGFINIVILYQVTKGFTGIYLENVFLDPDTGLSSMAHGGDKITMGRALLLNVICCIVYEHKNRYEFWIRVLFPAFAFLSLFMFNTRSSMVMCFICFFVYLWKQSKILHKPFLNIKYVGYLLLLILFILIMYLTIPVIGELIDIVFNNISSGVFGFFGKTSDSQIEMDSSSEFRYQSMLIFRNSLSDGILYLLFGHGMLHVFFDFPIIQCFYDMGVIVFAIYAYVLLLCPIKMVFGYLTSSKFIIIIQLLAIQYFFDQFYCGIPYWSFQFMPIVLILYFCKKKEKYEESIVENLSVG